MAPILFLVTYAYTLVQLVLLADKARRFDDELRARIKGLPKRLHEIDYKRAATIRSALRRQLPSNVFVQILAGPEDLREGAFGFLLRVIVWTTLAVGPILLLITLQLQFLPFHNLWVTCIHRTVLVVDILLLWWLWPRILLFGRAALRRRQHRRA